MKPDQEHLVTASMFCDLQQVVDAIERDRSLTIKVKESNKAVADSELEKITGVVSEFSTRFPRNELNRNANLKIAAKKIDGVVLAPGEEFSFNKTVGERTIRDGYQLAGIYKNGKHDKGIGGGICQVSRTLYNAALFANLQITFRRNHSMPVAYVPIGRDATVDYGGIDMRFRNSYSTPIAISSEFQAGRLTFRILGQPDPSMKVRIITSDHKTIPGSVKIVQYDDAPLGETVVVDKGSDGHLIATYRIVYRDGKEISHEFLGRSRYIGTDRILGRNLKAISGSLINKQEKGSSKKATASSAHGANSSDRRTFGPPD